MSQRNETSILVIILLVAIAIVSSGLFGIWWFLTKAPTVNQPKARVPKLATSDSPQRKNSSTKPQKVATFAQVKNVPQGLFKYGGSTTWAPINREVHPELEQFLPQFRLSYTDAPEKQSGSGSGIAMLLDNQLSFAHSSRPLKDIEQQRAAQQGIKLQAIPVAVDVIAIAVHPDLDIPGLTINQIKAIYTGLITNWRQVGGADLPIQPYSRQILVSGTGEFFVQEVLQGDEFSQNVEFVASHTEALKKVTTEPGAIYYASASSLVPQCKIKTLPVGDEINQLVPPYQKPWVTPKQCPQKRNQLNRAAFNSGDYPITRQLFVIVKQNEQLEQVVGEAYSNLLLTNQGQELIEYAGFVRTR